MADKNSVGRTVGIVLGVTAAVGLGLYLILRPKTASAASSTPIYSPTGSAEQVKLLEAQIAALQAKQKSEAELLTAQQKAANQAQLNSLLIQLGGQFVSKGLDYWSSGWGKDDTQSTYLDTSLGETAPSGVIESSTGSVGRYDYLNPWSTNYYG